MPENINLFDINEILKLLRGTYPLPREYRSQFEPQQLNVPTETYAVLRDYIYRNSGCKLFFQEALRTLFSGNADDVFLGAAYFEDCIVCEENKTASFSIDRERLIPLLKERIRRNAAELMHRKAFLIGSEENCMERLAKISTLYKDKYGFTILD